MSEAEKWREREALALGPLLCRSESVGVMGGVSYPRRRFANAAPLVGQTLRSGKRGVAKQTDVLYLAASPPYWVIHMVTEQFLLIAILKLYLVLEAYTETDL